MFVRVKRSAVRNSVVQLVEGVRDPVTNKVKQHVVRHVGSAASEEELTKLIELGEYLKFEIESQHQQNLLSAEKIVAMTMESKSREDCPKETRDYAIDDIRNLRQQQVNITGIGDVYGRIYQQLGFDKILYNPARQVHATDIIRNIVLARIANPQSKRESINFLANDYGINLKLDSVYKAMDKLDEDAIHKLQKVAFMGAQSLFKEKIDVLFYDATTLYFESFVEDELKSKGFSKDKKFSEVQILLSVFVTQGGIPIGYEIFPGATYEGHTLLAALDNLQQRFVVNNVVFVADSGMLNAINTEALEEAGYKYIVGARIKNMSKDITKQILNKESYEPLTIRDEDYSYKIIDLAKNQNLLVSYSAKRARKDAHDRSEALKKLMQKMKKSKKVQSIINASGYKKYLNINGNSSLEVSEEKIAQASNWDGLHGVITNIKNINPYEVLSQYKGLWQIEETFRISKHDLKIRPIYHWSPKRIKAHIAICFMALTCIRHLEYRVNLQQVKMSPNRIRKALTSTGVTILVHINDKRLFAVPFKINDDAKIIYKTMGLKLSACPYQL